MLVTFLFSFGGVVTDMDCYCAGKGSKKEKISVVEGIDVITNSICAQTHTCIVWLYMYILYKGSPELPSYTFSSCTFVHLYR